MVKVSPPFRAVNSSARRASSTTRAPNGTISPITLRRTLLRCRRSASCSSATMNSCRRVETSSAGRRQFSELNANKVRYSMPRSAQHLVIRRTVSTPCLWPATLGRYLFLAQRPLPSMIRAMCLGMLSGEGMSRVELLKEVMSGDISVESNGDQFCFFRGDHPVDIGDMLVGELLDVVLGASFLIFRDGLVLQQLLERVIGVTAQVAHRDANHALKELLKNK